MLDGRGIFSPDKAIFRRNPDGLQEKATQYGGKRPVQTASIRLLNRSKRREPFMMEQKRTSNDLWRVWVDTQRRIVSFHEEKGCQLLEFHSREMFLSCVDQYSGQQYRYQ
jgi:hypothetical protein